MFANLAKWREDNPDQAAVVKAIDIYLRDHCTHPDKWGVSRFRLLQKLGVDVEALNLMG